MPASESKRIYWIDQLRALAFLLVIAGHVYLPSKVNTYIYSFHMPLFFFISGMTLNPGKLISEPMKNIFLHNFKRLIIPYFWMNLLTFPLWVFTNKILSSNPRPISNVIFAIFYGHGEKYTTPSNALWFLLVLFFSNILIAALLKIFKGNWANIGTAAGFCAVLGYLDRNKLRIWHINTTFTAVVFILLGYAFICYCRENPLLTEKMPRKKYITAAVLLFITGFFAAYLNKRMSMYTNRFGRALWLYYIAAVATSLAVTLVVQKLPKIRILSFIGKNTMLYLGIHAPVIRIFEELFPKQMNNAGYTIPFVILLYFAIAPLCLLFNKYFPFAVGRSTPCEKAQKIRIGFAAMTAFCFFIPFFNAVDFYFPESLSSSFNLIIFLLVWLILSVFISVFAQKHLKICYLIDNQPMKKPEL